MIFSFENSSIWRRAFASLPVENEKDLHRLKTGFFSFRENVSAMVQSIGSELHQLTIHDITHIDALWEVASEIVGVDIDINPAEAFVLGGAFLLHDAAHVLRAYEGGLEEIKGTVEWQDVVALNFDGKDPEPKSNSESTAIFLALRHLHARQAANLAKMTWKDVSGSVMYLLQDVELREFYGELIGLVAASHHWPARVVLRDFESQVLSAPAFLSGAEWTVDALKIAFVLRCADAAHIDARRAPSFASSQRSLGSVSAQHWIFQNKLAKSRLDRDALLLSSGSSFSAHEQSAWWLAYDTARMIDRELRDAHSIFQETGRRPFAAASVMGADSPEAFSKLVRVNGWKPVDIVPKIDNIPFIIETLGGKHLYTNDNTAPVRELIQNALDATRAMRSLGELEALEGFVEIGLRLAEDPTEGAWLNVLDSGIGMSEYVIKNFLLGFGNSLWRSSGVSAEWPGLASTKFAPVGKFGIGFFSIFMLGDRIRVTSRRCRVKSQSDAPEQITLEFNEGLRFRPVFREPYISERLDRPGTNVSVLVSWEKIKPLFDSIRYYLYGPNRPGLQESIDPKFDPLTRHIMYKNSLVPVSTPDPGQLMQHNFDDQSVLRSLGLLAASIAPASDVTLRVRAGGIRQIVVEPNDWERVNQEVLLERTLTRSTISSPFVSLYSEQDGRILGRLGLNIGESIFGHEGAIIFEHGLKVGKNPFMGLVRGKHLGDPQRTKADALGSGSEWMRWVREAVKISPPLKREQLRQLAYMDPTADYELIRIGDQFFSFAQLLVKAKALTEVRVFFDEGRASFREILSLNSYSPKSELVIESSEFWVAPPITSGGIESMPKEAFPVNYLQKVAQFLSDAWGGELDIKCVKNQVLGKVMDLPVYRDAYDFYRSRETTVSD